MPALLLITLKLVVHSSPSLNLYLHLYEYCFCMGLVVRMRTNVRAGTVSSHMTARRESRDGKPVRRAAGLWHSVWAEHWIQDWYAKPIPVFAANAIVNWFRRVHASAAESGQ